MGHVEEYVWGNISEEGVLGGHDRGYVEESV